MLTEVTLHQNEINRFFSCVFRMNKTQFEKSVNPKKPRYQKKTFIWYDIKNFRKGIINCLFFLCSATIMMSLLFFFFFYQRSLCVNLKLNIPIKPFSNILVICSNNFLNTKTEFTKYKTDRLTGQKTIYMYHRKLIVWGILNTFFSRIVAKSLATRDFHSFEHLLILTPLGQS